ncbi:MAG: LysM peptidoglycan-binding domain-containing protein [bacterium]
MPANKTIRYRAMYGGYQAGDSLDAIAAEYRTPVDEIVREFMERGWEVRPADRPPEVAPKRRGRKPSAEPKAPKVPGAKRGRRGVPEDVVAKMEERYAAGRTLAEVAEEFHVSPATVGNVFKRAGIDIRARGTRSWPPELAQAMHALYESGHTIGMLADEYKLTPAQVRSCFKHHGLGLKAQTQKSQPTRDSATVRALYARFEGGEELDAIAVSQDVALGQLKRWFLLHHLPIQRFGRPMTKPAVPRPVVPVAEASEPVSSEPAGPSLMTDAPENLVEREQLASGMYELFLEGYSMSEIAAAYSTTAGVVQRLFAEFGMATAMPQRGAQGRSRRG